MASGVQVEHVHAGPQREVPKDELLPYMDDFAVQLARRWRLDPPDVVHGHFWMSGLAAIKAAGMTATPVLQTFHALGTVKRRWQGAADTSPSARIGLERRVACSVDRIIATCTDEVAELSAMGAAPGRIDVVPCGVDLDLFRTVDPQPAREGRPARLLVVGRLVERKGIEDAVRAMAYLPDAELVVVGGPSPDELAGDAEIARLAAVARECGTFGRITFTGRVTHDELPAVFRGADVLLAVPWYEPFGIVPLEAMACGVPVVATAVGGLLDTIVAGETGVFVDPRSPESIAAATQGLLADERRRAAMGAAGRERAQSRYGWNWVARKTEESYLSVLAEHRDAVRTAEAVR
jgi:glycosyltransferase involved in cell wall biosynthesis